MADEQELLSPEQFDPKRGIKYIKDPIYGYVVITSPDPEKYGAESTEQDIIDTDWMQRLRRIRQTQESFIVYPGAEHSRFQHSLGVMHLAGRFAKTVYTHFRQTISEKGDDIRQRAPEFPENHYFPSANYIEETFRLAGLLHDIGHGPFSHALDEVWATYEHTKHHRPSLTHEAISRTVIKDLLGDTIRQIKRSPSGPFEQGEVLDPADIAWLVKPYAQFTPSSPVLAVLKPIINGMYAADSMDYVMRDGYHCGTPEYAKVDVDRLVNTTFIAMSPSGQMLLCLHKGSLPALKAFLIATLLMYETVYYHKTCRAFRLDLDALLPETLEFLGIEDPLQNLDSYKSLDDFALLSLHQHRSSQSKSPQLLDAWRKLSNRKLDWKQAWVHEDHLVSADMARYLDDILRAQKKEIEAKIRDELRELQQKEVSELALVGFNQDGVQHLQSLDLAALELHVDIRQLNVRPEDRLLQARVAPGSIVAVIYDPRTKKASPLSLYQFIKDLPIKYTATRVFCRADDRDVVALAADLADLP